MQDYYLVLAYLRGILNKNYQKFRIFKNIMLNLLQAISKHFFLKNKLTILLFYLFISNMFFKENVKFKRHTPWRHVILYL